MKNLIFSIFLFLVLFHQALFSQDPYFGVITDVDLYTPQIFTEGTIFFDLEEINTNYLDIAITQEQDAFKYGQWNENNGSGTFGNYTLFTTETLNNFVCNFFVKLRATSETKDLVIGLNNGLQVYYNENGMISSIPINYNGGSNWSFFESGSFNYSDNYEDIVISNGTSTIYYFRNNNDGTLQGPNNVSLPYNAYDFRIEQLNEKTQGYTPIDPLDREDIICIDRSHQSSNNDIIYAYKNYLDNLTYFSGFETDKPKIVDLEVADIDGDGYNDIIVICQDAICPSYLYVRIYKNFVGMYIETSPMWSCTLPVAEVACNGPYKITIADLNKDGANDLVLVFNYSNIEPAQGIRAMAFINTKTIPIYSQEPNEIVNGIEETGNFPQITNVVTADIYGGQYNDGGGIALLVSYFFEEPGGSGNKEMHVKVVNAHQSQKYSPPPPPILERFLEYNPQNGIWHPHLHLNHRGERDFDHFEIWKWKLGWPNPIPYEDVTEAEWTDYAECVFATGGDLPQWNCYYFAKSVDVADPPKKSEPSRTAYYQVGCEPVCDGCEGGDDPITNLNQNNIKSPEKFSTSSFPNPFNPTTKISYSLPYASNVIIKVFDIMGRLIKELVNDHKSAGYYSVIFNGSNLASGIYFYKIETEKSVIVNKIVLIR